ncbi:PREDICTED: NAC domain-containing protein 104-like [Nelumbo nucifera]|uniref:NAC domain-containing protein 104-like n=1 Tax=Nelumbo nucifera TaxID=4432 RepID=A0A1U8B3S0_NELNU|nr:PREDICTED: NAC domain-containing protein 104-like [Nelumbo nucifera]
MGDGNVNLPPGFRFYPTDEELVVHFLYRKAALLPCHPDVIPDLDLYPYDPWELSGKALEGINNHWYFFSRRTPNRISANGYWKPLGVDEPIFTGESKKVGMKKYLVFYLGEAPTGIKTNWVMQEYRLSDSGSSSRSSRKKGNSKMDSSRLVLCRVYERSGGSQGSFCDEDGDGTELSCLDEVFLSLDDLDEISLPN